jgi:mRNA-degrading endonuclease toxin of MazEF toxin-antitoxin module
MQKMVPKIKKGDIFVMANLGAEGHEQKGTRPHVVVTQVTGGTVTVAPCTTVKKNRKYTIEIKPDSHNHLDKISFVLISQAFAPDTSFLGKKLGA